MGSRLAIHREAAAREQHWRCRYCGLPMGGRNSPYELQLRIRGPRLMVSAEHLVARKDGGTDARDNIAAAHVHCNRQRHRRKRPLSPAKFGALVRSRLDRSRWFQAAELRLLTDAAARIG